MNNKIILLLFSIVLYSSCHSAPKDLAGGQVHTPPDLAVSKPPNEAQKSELATLMQRMYAVSQSTHNQILSDNQVVLDTTGFGRLHLATPTDSAAVWQPDFHFKANHFLQTAAGLAMATSKTKKAGLLEKYNIMVASCMACHQSYCPGPLKKIKKLYL